MSRRLVGIVLLAVVVIAAVAASRAAGVRVAGAGAVPLGLGVPAVGACVAAVTGPVSVGLPTQSMVVTSVGEKGVRFADCADPHLGEVIAVRSDLTTTFSASTNEKWCRDVATGYRPWAISQVADAVRQQWTPAAGTRVMLILSALPGALAFKWAACALTSPDFELYRSSFVRSATGGPPPAPFGLCLPTGDSSVEVSCSAAHRAQEFGTTTTPATPETVESCQELIASMTGMPDITAGGLLHPIVFTPTAAASASQPTTSCRLAVVGQSILAGTLAGVGNGPLPWIS